MSLLHGPSMPPPYRNILAAIDSLQQRSQPALSRAMQLARATGARLVLFHSLYLPLGAAHPGTRGRGRSDVTAHLEAAREALDRLAGRARRQGIEVAVQVAWDYPPFEAIVREAMRTHPDLLVAQNRRRGLGARLLLTNTDWQLIRHCPVPLLFVKRSRPYGALRVLAAVDPLHPHDKPADLDARILGVGAALASTARGRLDAVHAYQPARLFEPRSFDQALAPRLDPRLDRSNRLAAQAALERVTAPFGLPRARLHLAAGDPADVIPQTARKLAADVVVMGAVSRRGLERLLIGSTAESALDQIPCDVLVVKPRAFRTAVAPVGPADSQP